MVRLTEYTSGTLLILSTTVVNIDRFGIPKEMWILANFISLVGWALTVEIIFAVLERT